MAAFFDIDKTLVNGASLLFLARAARTLGIVSLRDLARFGWEAVKFRHRGEHLGVLDEVRDRGMRLLGGVSAERLHRLAASVVQRMRLRMWPESQELLRAHLAAGHEVWLISATPDFLAQELAVSLGATGGIGTGLESRTASSPAASPVHDARPREGAAVRRSLAVREIDPAAATPTPTPSTTSPCSRSWAPRWRSTPTASSPRARRRPAGAPCGSTRGASGRSGAGYGLRGGQRERVAGRFRPARAGGGQRRWARATGMATHGGDRTGGAGTRTRAAPSGGGPRARSRGHARTGGSRPVVSGAMRRLTSLLVATLVTRLAQQLAVLLLGHALATLLDDRTHTNSFTFRWRPRHRYGPRNRPDSLARGATGRIRGSGQAEREMVGSTTWLLIAICTADSGTRNERPKRMAGRSPECTSR